MQHPHPEDPGQGGDGGGVYLGVGVQQEVAVLTPVSYTHLDVYKRQVFVKERARGTRSGQKSRPGDGKFHRSKKGLPTMTEERIARLNELARKSKTIGLTEEEKQEQALLRQEYLAAIRQSLEAQLDNVYIVEKDGTQTKLKKKGQGPLS